jgi:hypothetical protein
MATNNAVNITASGIVRYDGAGTFDAITLTQYSPLVGAASNGITSLGPMTNGQILIGSTGASPVVASLTAGANITITPGAGTISIASTAGAGLTWNDATDATYTFVVQNGYVTNRGGGVTYTLPATAALGEIVRVVGKSGLATIAQNANQQICTGDTATTVGVGGTLTATDAGDCIELVCITAGASTVWRAATMWGNWAVV